MNIYQKLNQARKQFHSQELRKSGHNKFAGYNYFELGDFIIPALSIFDQLGLVGMVSFGPEVATLSIIDCDKPDDRIQFTSPMSSAALKGCHEVQNLGAVQTYLRRYLWVAALEIVEHDALDSSKGAEPKVNAISNPKLKIAALDGIGDDLPQESRDALKELAAEVVDICKNDSPQAALNAIKAFEPQGDERIYLDRHLPSDVRSALRKVSQPAKAA